MPHLSTAVPIAWALVLAAVILLAGCGGGDEEEVPKDHQPLDCKARPELCQ